MTVINDNIQPFEAIEERDLHAYIDGLLDDARAKKVEDYLKRHPEKAAEVQDYITYNKLLRKAYEQECDEAVPQRLLTVLNRPSRTVWPVIGKVAAVILLCTLSAGGGWLGATKSSASSAQDNGMISSFLHQVSLDTKAAFETEQVERLNISTAQKTDPLNWLTQKIALEMQAPNLTQAGYTLESRRLVTRGLQEFVELEYAHASGETIKLYMKTRWEKEAPSIEFAQKEDQSIAYWQEGPLVYALSGSLDRKHATQIADLVRSAMTEVPDNPPQVQQDVKIMNPQPVTPVQPVQQTQGLYGISPLDQNSYNQSAH